MAPKDLLLPHPGVLTSMPRSVAVGLRLALPVPLGWPIRALPPLGPSSPLPPHCPAEYTLDPVWKPFTVPLVSLCDGDMEKPIQVCEGG